MEETLIISKKEYRALIKDSLRLNALEAYGVDNWEGYEDAMDSLPKTYCTTCKSSAYMDESDGPVCWSCLEEQEKKS